MFPIFTVKISDLFSVLSRICASVLTIALISTTPGLFIAELALAQGVPYVINYQGRLNDSSGDALGGSGTDYYFRFSIYDDATPGSGTKLWPAGAPSATTVSVTNGLFSVNIGDDTEALDYDFNSESENLPPG
ncbi:MAG: hypothetical protein R3B52_00145 [Candidatus Paceibacterota bacterium]